MPTRRGKLIVIDGVDGVGKATQTKLLVARLRREGRRVQTIDFPRYYANFFGRLIGECLAGRHGNFVKLDPYIASVLYAADRWETKPKLEAWLQAGQTVILDRYVSANQLHQGGKMKDEAKRRVFLRWLDTLEHKIFGLPRPDAIIYLHLPLRLVLRLLKNKNLAGKKRYTGGGKDQAEASVAYLRNTQNSALKIIKAKNKNQWWPINCAARGAILARAAIHEQVYAAVKRVLC